VGRRVGEGRRGESEDETENREAHGSNLPGAFCSDAVRKDGWSPGAFKAARTRHARAAASSCPRGRWWRSPRSLKARTSMRIPETKAYAAIHDSSAIEPAAG
jgi:hypothetical protein